MDGLENEIDELVDEEFEVPQPENEAGLSNLLDCFIFFCFSIHILFDT